MGTKGMVEKRGSFQGVSLTRADIQFDCQNAFTSVDYRGGECKVHMARARQLKQCVFCSRAIEVFPREQGYWATIG
jgi:hypothetical protein